MGDKTRRLFWTSRTGIKLVAEGVPFDVYPLMFGATCPSCCDAKVTAYITELDFVAKTYGHRDRKGRKVTHKFPKQFLEVSRDGLSLEMIDTKTGEVTVFKGRERTTTNE